MKTIRVLTVLVEGESKSLVDRAADLILDELKLNATFIESSMEFFSDEAAGKTADDPPGAPILTITIRNNMRQGLFEAASHGGG